MIKGFNETAPLTDAERELIPILIKGFNNYVGKNNYWNLVREKFPKIFREIGIKNY